MTTSEQTASFKPTSSSAKNNAIKQQATMTLSNTANNTNNQPDEQAESNGHAQQQTTTNNGVVNSNNNSTPTICSSKHNDDDNSSSLNGSRCNLTLVLHEKLRMELEQRPLPAKPKANEVTLATHTVGICGSDVKYWQQGKIGNFILTKPMILGHETSAIVIECGENVKQLQPGDKVAVEVGLPCSACQLCRAGKYNLCKQMAFAATPPYDGTLTRYFNHPANFCFKLPESVSLEDGALLEPLAVAVHACQRAPIKLNDIVLVCGAGAVGLLSMLTARAFGASHVLITDISESRLAFARSLGASETLLCTRDQKPSEMATQIRQLVAKLRSGSSGGLNNNSNNNNKSTNLSTNISNSAAAAAEAQQGVDVVLECSGAESSFNLAIQSAAVGAQIVCVGCQPDEVTVALNCAIMQEIDIKGVFRYRNCYPLALSLVESGKINLRPLVTHRFRLEDSLRAFETCCRGEGVKIMIKCMDDKLNFNVADEQHDTELVTSSLPMPTGGGGGCC